MDSRGRKGRRLVTCISTEDWVSTCDGTFRVPDTDPSEGPEIPIKVARFRGEKRKSSKLEIQINNQKSMSQGYLSCILTDYLSFVCNSNFTRHPLQPSNNTSDYTLVLAAPTSGEATRSSFPITPPVHSPLEIERPIKQVSILCPFLTDKKNKDSEEKPFPRWQRGKLWIQHLRELNSNHLSRTCDLNCISGALVGLGMDAGVYWGVVVPSRAHVLES